jgi:hypothetical protein
MYESLFLMMDELMTLVHALFVLHTMQIELTRGYGVNEFHEDLKRLLIQARGLHFIDDWPL